MRVRASTAAGGQRSLDGVYKQYRAWQHVFSASASALSRSVEPRRAFKAHSAVGDFAPRIMSRGDQCSGGIADDSDSRGCARDHACCARLCAAQGGNREAASATGHEHVGKRVTTHFRRTVSFWRVGMTRLIVRVAQCVRRSNVVASVAVCNERLSSETWSDPRSERPFAIAKYLW